jgi:iron complex transport system substrate-binding protein
MLFGFHSLYAESITVTDLFGREVTISEKVEKLVAVGPGALRLVSYVRAQDMLVGREMFEDKLDKSIRPYTYAFPKNYYDLPVISAGGPGKMPDVEKIIAVAPDVIIASAFTKEQLNLISEKTQIPVVGVDYGDVGHASLGKVKDSLRLLGYITGRQVNSQMIMNRMAMMTQDLLERSEGVKPKSVFMASIAFKGARGFTSTERNHPVLSLLKLVNIADDINVNSGMGTHLIMQTEAVLLKQPDYIFYDITGLSILKDTYANNYATLKMLKAVNEKRVFTTLPYNWYNSNIENIFLTAYFIGKTVYSDRFEDIDIAQKADEIYNVFLGTNPYAEISSKTKVFRGMIFEKGGFSFTD